MASVFVSSPAEIVVIDSRTRSGTITLPLTNSIPYRVVSFKDQYGSFSNSTLTLSTQVGESFDDGTTTKTFSNAFGFASLYATSSKWMVMNATTTQQQTISSLTVNQLTFGTGAGWVQFGPLQATIVSSIQEQTNAAYINNLYIGNTSTLNSAQYNGLFGNYNNTVLAEISTGAGTQEFLVFKGSSTSDRVRVQTTGTFVVETGVSARLFSNTTLPTLSNATPAFIINTSSNVGIQTASPGATLDVAGTGRAITLSSQQLFVSSINGAALGNITTGNVISTVTGLGSAGYISTLSLVSTTRGLQTTGFLSSLNLLSTVQGLGSAGYVSTLSLVSTTSSLIYDYGAGLSTLSTAIFNSPFVYPGQLLYLNYGISTLTSDYRALQAAPRPLNAGYVVNTPLAGNSISSVAAFQSDFYLPSFIPAGFWENRLFAYASGTGVTAFTELYDRSPLGVETLIKTTSTATTSILTGTSPQENIINMNVPITGISTGHTIVWKIFGSNSTAVPRNMFSYFENGNTYSYLITTFGGTAGYDFPAAFSTLALFTSNTSNYFSSQIVSTNRQLISTVGGLGSAGYLSSLSNIPYLSAQQIYASSIVFQTLVGPTTVVLYEY